MVLAYCGIGILIDTVRDAKANVGGPTFKGVISVRITRNGLCDKGRKCNQK